MTIAAETLPPLVVPAAIAAASQGKVEPTDPRAAALAAGVSAAIRGYCGWHIAPRITRTVTVDTDGGTECFLPTGHLVQILDCTVLDPHTGARTAVDPDTLQWSAAGMVRLPGGRAWPDAYRSAVFTIEDGHDLVPEVTQVAVQAAVGAAANPAGWASMTIGPATVGMPAPAGRAAGTVALLEQDKAALAAYRLGARP